jgi:asparagine synthase (glutamine-hydrolysing)
MDGRDAFIQISCRGGAFVQSGARAYAFGTDLPHRIGSVSWSWDGQSLVAETCRYGVRPLFYCALPDRIILSPSILEMLRQGAPGDLDLAAIGVFIRFGSFLGEHTPFAAIRVLPPGGVLRWDGRLALSGGPHAVEPRSLGRADAITAYVGLFRAAIERCAGPRSLVPLSGGRDSRHIAFETQRLGRLASCITQRYTPPKPNEDLTIASLVTQALGLPHVTLRQTGDRLDNERGSDLACQLAACCHYWMQPLAAYLDTRQAAGTGTDADAPVLDGLAGDVLSNGLFLTPALLGLYREGRLREIADHLLADGQEYLPYLADRELMPIEPARERMIDELARHQGAVNPVASFFFWNRTRRCIAQAPFGILGAHRVHCPYLDPALFDFLLGLPPELFLDHRFHTDTIHAAFPEYAHLPFETKGGRPVRARWHFRTYGARLIRRLLLTRSDLIDRRYCLYRLGYMAATGSYRFVWVAHACVYFDLLAEARDAGSDGQPTEPDASDLPLAASHLWDLRPTG